MKSVLQEAKFEVETVSDGAECLDIFEVFNPDLVLIDIKMPTLSGYDLARLLKERANKGVKLIYVSILPEGNVPVGEVDGFVQKPFSPEGLVEAVKSF